MIITPDFQNLIGDSLSTRLHPMPFGGDNRAYAYIQPGSRNPTTAQMHGRTGRGLHEPRPVSVWRQPSRGNPVLIQCSAWGFVATRANGTHLPAKPTWTSSSSPSTRSDRPSPSRVCSGWTARRSMRFRRRGCLRVASAAAPAPRPAWELLLFMVIHPKSHPPPLGTSVRLVRISS
jgi:hypothetical protein